MICPLGRLVSGLVEQRLPDLLHRPAVVPLIGPRGLLGTKDERLQRCEIRKPLVALRMAKDEVEQLERRPRGEKVVHIRIPRTIEARDERQPRVTLEEDEPRLMNRGDRHPIVPGAVSRSLLQVAERSPQSLALTRLDTEKQAELARRANHCTRPNSCVLRSRHHHPSLEHPNCCRSARSQPESDISREALIQRGSVRRLKQPGHK